MTAAERADRTARADEACRAAYQGCGGPGTGAALVAVGGYGRGELAPYSDLDVVLVCDEGIDLGPVAEQVWYPLWDTGTKLDHAVRNWSEMLAQAEEDPRVALGLLDLRHVAGDPNLTLRLRSTLLAQWRRRARITVPQVRDLVAGRHHAVGELAHLSVPDLKESEGGVRDATVLRALVATWLVDVPHVELERSRVALLDVRDALHDVAGRGTDRIAPEHWSGLAARLGLPDDLAAQAHVRELGRRITHLSRLTWRRAEGALSRARTGPGPRRPSLTPLGRGIALAAGEVVLDARAQPEHDPVLLLRASAVAAEHDVVLAPATVARLVREAAPLPTPWPGEARELLVRLLAAGPGLLGVWETLEETGAWSLILPEWQRVRLLPHASPVHRFTVDRHLVETCIEASRLIRQVARPDVLLVAALLHDIGKGGDTEHSLAGEPIARGVAERMGFEAEAVDLIAMLVRCHLLLIRAATTRDVADPATHDLLTAQIPNPDALALLAALTEADARATSSHAWSSWRSGLVRDLVRRTRAVLDAEPVPAEVPPPLDISVDAGRGLWLHVEPAPDGSRVTCAAPDRIGLLADLAAVFALQRVPVRAARAWPQPPYGISSWEVAEPDLDARLLRQRFEAVVSGAVDPGARLRPASGPGLEASVELRADASARATVLEVRAADRTGLVYLVCAALAELGIAVRSAHVTTFGPQAVDVFYLQEPAGGALSDVRATTAAGAVRGALTPS